MEVTLSNAGLLIKLKFNTSKLLYKHLQLTPFCKLFTFSIQLQYANKYFINSDSNYAQTFSHQIFQNKKLMQDGNCIC